MITTSFFTASLPNASGEHFRTFPPEKNPVEGKPELIAQNARDARLAISPLASAHHGSRADFYAIERLGAGAARMALRISAFVTSRSGR